MDSQFPQEQFEPKSSLSLPFIIFLALFFSAALASFVLFQPKQVSEVVKVDDTSSWKTYENRDLGFSFSYPDDLYFDAQMLGDGLLDWASIYPYDRGGFGGIYFFVFKWDPNDIRNNKNKLVKTEKTVSNGIGWTIEYYDYLGDEKEEPFFIVYFFIKDNIRYEFMIDTKDNFELYDTDLEKIPLTFKFNATSTNAVSTSKTFISKEFGVSFNYPSAWPYEIANNDVIFAKANPNIPNDVPPGLVFSGYSSFEEMKYKRNFSGYYWPDFLTNEFHLGSTTKIVNDVYWKCGDLDGPGAQFECFSLNAPTGIQTLVFNVSDRSLIDTILSSFKFITSTTTINGYYEQKKETWYDAEELCDTFTVIHSEQWFADKYAPELEKFGINIDLGNLSTTSRNMIKNSSATNPVSILVKEKEPFYHDAPSCAGDIDILSVSK